MSKHQYLACPSYLQSTGGRNFTTYLLINMISKKQYLDTVIFNSDILSYYYSGNINTNFKDELVYLEQCGLIEKLSGTNYYITSYTNIEPPFIMFPEEDFLALLNINKRNKMDLILFYAKLLDSMNYNIEVNGQRKIIGHMPYSFFGNKSTVGDYMQTLQNLGLIYVVKRGVNETNLYCRTCHKELLDQFYEGSSENNNSNFRRSVSARYNRYLANPGVYSHEEKVALYNDCIEYNKQMKNMQKYQPGDDYVSKIKDISVFSVDETE